MTDRKTKVLLVTNLFPTPVAPTRGVFVLEMVRQLRSRCDVTVVCPLPYFPRLPFLKYLKAWYPFSQVPSEYTIDGIKVHSPKYLLVPRLSESLHAFLMFLGIRSTIKRIERTDGFDLINAQWMYPDGVAAAWVARSLKKEIIITGHGSDVNTYFDEPAKKSQMLRSFNIAAAITVVSNAMKEKLVRNGVKSEKLTVISNGFDPAVFHERSQRDARAVLSLPQDRKIVLFVGRMLETKGVFDLVEAARSLAREKPDLQVIFVGDGPAVSRVRALIIEYNLDAHVKCVGGKPHDEVASWMAACDVFCLPSFGEGCPTVVLEALACGRPVVATRVGGIPDFIDDSNGALMDPHDAPALANALSASLDRVWDAKAIRAGVEDLTWDAAAERYAKLFTGRRS